MQSLTKNFVTKTDLVTIVHDPVTVVYPETSVTTTKVIKYFAGMSLYEIGLKVFAEALAINPKPFNERGTHMIPAWIDGATHIVKKDDAMAYFNAHGGFVVSVPGIVVENEMVYIDALQKTLTTTVVTPAYSVTTPGYTETVARTYQDPNLGWNAGARTRTVMEDNFTYDFSINPGSQDVVIGLSAPVNDVGVSWEEIEWGLEFAAGRYRVVERGVAKTAWVVNSDTTGQDVFQIRRVGQRIAYWREGVLIDESATLCPYPQLIGDAALYAGGDAIWNAAFVEDNTAGADIALGALQTATDLNPAYASVVLYALAGSAFGYATYDVQRLVGLQGLASDIPDVQWLAPLTTDGYGLTTLVGTAEFALRPLAALAADYAYAEAQIELLPLANLDIPPAEATMAGFLMRFTGQGQAVSEDEAAYGWLCAFVGTAAGADSADGALCEMLGTAATLPDNWAMAQGLAPVVLGEAWSLTGSLATADQPWNWQFVGSAEGADDAVGALLGFLGVADDAPGSVASGAGALLGFAASGSSHAEAWAEAAGALFRMEPMWSEASGILSLLSGSGWSVGLAATRRTWVVNLRLEEVTEYLNYDFIGLYRLGDAVYGLKPDGLYRLGGKTDAGAPIPARFRPARDDYGTSQHKRIAYLYLGSDDPFQVTVTADGKSAGPFVSDIGTQRARLARGLKGRYWDFEVSNVLGQPLQVDGFEPLVSLLRRRVG